MFYDRKRASYIKLKTEYIIIENRKRASYMTLKAEYTIFYRRKSTRYRSEDTM